MGKSPKTAATETTALVAKRFLEVTDDEQDEGGNDDGGYYFYDMDDDDLNLYDGTARKSFCAFDILHQTQQPGLARDSADSFSDESGAPSFPKSPLPDNHTGVNSQPRPGMGPNGKPLLPTIHAEDMPWKVRLFSIASIVMMGLIYILFKHGGKWARIFLQSSRLQGC